MFGQNRRMFQFRIALTLPHVENPPTLNAACIQLNTHATCGGQSGLQYRSRPRARPFTESLITDHAWPTVPQQSSCAPLHVWWFEQREQRSALAPCPACPDWFLLGNSPCANHEITEIMYCCKSQAALQLCTFLPTISTTINVSPYSPIDQCHANMRRLMT